MKKEHVFVIVMVVVVAATSGAVYQFYFRPQLEIYAQDQQHAELLEQRLKRLDEVFGGFEPSTVVSAWRGQVQPWTEALFERGDFFNLGELYDTPPVPEQMMLKFWYRDESKRMLDQLQKKINSKEPPCRYPNPLRFGAPYSHDYATMDKTQVTTGLRLIKIGSTMVEMLLNANASEITAVEIWPPRFAYGDLLHMRTTGLEFKMTMENLVKFIEGDIRMARRYLDIEALSLSNTQLRSQHTPELAVRMLLTQAQFKPGRAGVSSSGETPQPRPGAGRRAMMAQRQQERRESTRLRSSGNTRWDRFVGWLKFNFWPF
ncbi:MAG TPA: hypothetical protein ENN80_14625 [Candidatus Hydrogenedentes bacterium]|nr:hypothetical protein [Candidatus Hydrogenedentota bacterium]